MNQYQVGGVELGGFDMSGVELGGFDMSGVELGGFDLSRVKYLRSWEGLNQVAACLL